MLFSVNLYCLWCERHSRAYYEHKVMIASRFFIAKGEPSQSPSKIQGNGNPQ